MGCLGIAIAALLALAVPASIAHTSLVGAYVVIAVLAAVAVGALAARRRATGGALGLVAVVVVAYALVVSLIHAT